MADEHAEMVAGRPDLSGEIEPAWKPQRSPSNSGERAPSRRYSVRDPKARPQPIVKRPVLVRRLCSPWRS